MDLLCKGYDFSTVFPEGSIDEHWRDLIRAVVVNMLEKLQDRCSTLRPDYDALKNFFTQLHALALAIEQKKDDREIEGLLKALQTSQESQESKRHGYGR
ncbi:MAG: hypothetical protein ABIH77_04585 [Pseudomonadota bacterium]|nr:hypothetical protein [Gammaproteobacteria bacterium]MBU1558828.1 hypothetical protein [Gammaproteobacteria bacterium]MBU1628577.1 hypothetical protein [Gammaproteobacteria bacterium]